MSRIAVLGSGAWGTAIALSLHRRGGHQVTLWAHSPEAAQEIVEAGENTLFLPGFPIPPELAITGDGAAVAEAEIVVSVVPSEFLRPTLARLRPYLHSGQIILSATKGVEDHTFLRMTEVIAASLAEPALYQGTTSQPAIKPDSHRASYKGTASQPAIKPDSHRASYQGTASQSAEEPDSDRVLYQGTTGDPLGVVPQTPQKEVGALQSAEEPDAEGGGGFNPRIKPTISTGALAPEGSFSALPIGALSGPSFALEVAQGQPTAVTVAFADPAIAARIQHEFSSETLRLYTSTDLIGVELGGALKNVIAIAAGVAAGIGLGHNSAAALITRGIAEITRLAVACGGRRETLAGLSGVGDLVLTCTGSLSRNRTVGEALGQGRNLPEILASLGGKVAEGVLTTRAALGLARQHGIEMPITEQMELILNEGKDPREAIKALMLRPGKHEH